MSAMAPDRKKQSNAAPERRESGWFESPRRVADEIGLHAYAAMCLELELAETPAARQAVFTLFKTTEDTFRTIDGYWRALFAADESLLRDYRRLYDMQRVHLRYFRRKRR
jgi:hypothetical protein